MSVTYSYHLFEVVNRQGEDRYKMTYNLNGATIEGVYQPAVAGCLKFFGLDVSEDEIEYWLNECAEIEE